ncbi:MAG: hypothetical protein GOMPHAMPRED_003748 [Gomphillus americanus]|uniref:Uncharacterized protein n=1 Tax=Gomphillus americanus TaxID=1940652 RepID=A0A8H3FGN0_9LECA|nr:MAG: hypothetical protein GOMPHAMPRED_003748 [Gomphillus americanus]
MDVVAGRMDQSGVEFDATAIGFGIRGSTMPVVVERFERLVEMYQQKAPNARRIFNYSPDSTLWSVAHRFPLEEDCEAAKKPGKLLGYEEICDKRCDIEKKQYQKSKTLQQNSMQEGQVHDEL